MVENIRAITRNTELVDTRRNQIVHHATKLFVEKGFAHTTMSEIAEHCDMGKGSLYNYVASKEDIVYLILDYTQQVHGQSFAEINSRLSTLSVTDALRQAIQTYIKDVDEMQDEYNFLNHMVIGLEREGRRKMLGASVRVTDYFEVLLAKGVDTGEFKVENPRLIGHLISRMCSAWAHNRWFLGRLMSLDDFTKQLTDFILKAIAVDQKVPPSTEPRVTRMKWGILRATRLD